MSKSFGPGRLSIDGEWRDAASGKTFRTINPADEETLAEVADGGELDADAAIAAARAAFDDGEWSRMDGAARGRILWRAAELIQERLEDIAEWETLDAGKTRFDSGKIEIPLAAEAFRYYAGWAGKVGGETVPVRGNVFNYTLREPIGVVGAIVPFNFPFLLASYKVAAALASGNTVVLKPSPVTPLTALRMAEILRDAGLPRGAFNVVTGMGTAAGAALVRSPLVDKISFTGSTEVGIRIMKDAADTLKRVTLELGGKSANVVFADSDLEAATKGALGGIFYNKGEVCTAGSRLLVERSVHDEFVERLRERAGKLTVGDPREKSTRMGPVASRAQYDRVLGFIDKGKAEGARVVSGGGRPEGAAARGFFVQPTVFDRVTPEMTIHQEEIFGPVVAVTPFDDADHAVKIANGTRYGLAAAVWTRDVGKAHRMARRLRAGTVWVNTYGLYDPASPFGGVKASGLGRELGRAALDHYTESKSVWVSLD